MQKKRIKKTIVFIDEFGHIVPKEQSKYEVTLTGSYNWSYFLNAYFYEIETITPNIPLKTISSKEFLCLE